MKNKLREKEIENEQIASSSSSKKENKVGRSFKNVVSGNFLSKEKTLKHLPFVIFLSFLSLCYIANGYFADDQVRKVNHLMNEIKELRTQYIVVKDSLVIKSKQTEVAKALTAQETGIKESVVPPKKILIKANNPALPKD
jgi:hypothetical protein